MRWWLAKMLLAGALALALPQARSSAADLRVDFTELAQVMQRVLADAKVKLDNAPGFLGFGIGGGSSFAFGSTTLPIELPASNVAFAGTQVVYYVSDISSTRVTATPGAGVLRLSIYFEDAGPELVGDCVAGLCGDQALPNIEWARPAVHVDLVPVEIKGSVALAARKVEIGGELTAVCRSNVGLISSGVCSALRPVANGAIRRLRGELPERFRAKLNEPETQEKMAAGLKRLLTLGPAGEVRIAKIAVDAKGLLISFRF